MGCRGVAEALPALSAAKGRFANRPCARLAEALREAGRVVAARGGVAPLRPYIIDVLIWPRMSYWCPEVALKSPYQIGRELCIKIPSAQQREVLILNKTKKGVNK